MSFIFISNLEVQLFNPCISKAFDLQDPSLAQSSMAPQDTPVIPLPVSDATSLTVRFYDSSTGFIACDSDTTL